MLIELKEFQVKGMLGFWKYTHEISQNEVFSSK